jgi:hypothetical protein
MIRVQSQVLRCDNKVGITAGDFHFSEEEKRRTRTFFTYSLTPYLSRSAAGLKGRFQSGHSRNLYFPIFRAVGVPRLTTSVTLRSPLQSVPHLCIQSSLPACRRASLAQQRCSISMDFFVIHSTGACPARATRGRPSGKDTQFFSYLT